MATHPKVLCLTLDPKLTYNTHIHISVQAHTPLQMIKHSLQQDGVNRNARIDPTGFCHRSSGDKSVGCVLQANKCLTSCDEAPHYVQIQRLRGSPTPYACSQSCSRWQCTDRSCERVNCCLRFSLCCSSDIGSGHSFNTLLFPRSLVSESTTCVCRFWRLSFLLAPSLGRTVE